MAANGVEEPASNYQTNPNPARYSDVRADRATLEKLSIVRTLPNAPDPSIRSLAGDSAGHPGRCYAGRAFAGSQESFRKRACESSQDKLKDRLSRKLAINIPDGLQQDSQANGFAHRPEAGISRCAAQSPVRACRNGSARGCIVRLRGRIPERL